MAAVFDFVLPKLQDGPQPSGELHGHGFRTAMATCGDQESVCQEPSRVSGDSERQKNCGEPSSWAIRTLSESDLLQVMPMTPMSVASPKTCRSPSETDLAYLDLRKKQTMKPARVEAPDLEAPGCIPGCIAPRIDEKAEVEEVSDKNVGMKSSPIPPERVPDFSIVVHPAESALGLSDGDLPKNPGTLDVLKNEAGLSASDRPDSRERSLSASNASERKTSKGRQTSHTSSYAVSQSLKNKSGNLKFCEAVEPSMQVYLEDHCADGPSTMGRQLILWKILMSVLFLLPILSFGVLLIPLAPAEAGFSANWVFNYISHPILNYITSRAFIETAIRRGLHPSQKHRVNWIANWFPLVGSAVCLSVHLIGSAFDIFPVPFVVSTSCLPSMVVATMVASSFVPADLMTVEMRRFKWFAFLGLFTIYIQFAVLTGWLLMFPSLSVAFQFISCFAVMSMLSGVGWAAKAAGQHLLGVPEYIAEEVKIQILFIAFLFSAALLSSAKNGLVLVTMLALDAGKAIAVALKLCRELVATFREGEASPTATMPATMSVETKSSNWKSWFLQLRQACVHLRALPVQMREWQISAAQTRERLREVIAEFQSQTVEGLQEAEIAVADARLLNQLARYAKLFALVELSEVMVPFMYLLVIGTLHTDTFGYNREHFFVFDQLGESYHDAMVSNVASLAIEVAVFAAALVIICCLTGFDLLYFAGVVLKENYSYWVLSMATCCLAWLFVLVNHGGHNLKQIQSWLSP